MVRGPKPTSNLEVEPHHTFFAGGARVLVHNSGDLEVRRATRDYASMKLRRGQIYHVSVRVGNAWKVVYVGSTNDRDLTFGRFENGHLREGVEGHPHYKEFKARWVELQRQGFAAQDTEFAATFASAGAT